MTSRAAGLALLLAACAREPVADDYDDTCDEPEDCVAVVDEGYCGNCDVWEALPIDAALEFGEDQQRYTPRCPTILLMFCGELTDPPDVTCGGEGTCVIE